MAVFHATRRHCLPRDMDSIRPESARISRLYEEHVAPVSRPQEQGENFIDKMKVRAAIMQARKDKDSEALKKS